ncbi:MAG: hypothetical protein L6R38_009039 [Xanthoria sp. 2 TBL-2021]|nr:MAG: hypothetical protein L6R38_009039 [Xanthoria sp. 2 TBL-2021]
MEIDYSLYLVTDSTPAILGKNHLEDVVRAAVEGGVTVVQYRDKHSDTGDLIRTAQSLRTICRQHAVPLIINDRVDVALAVDADGIHLGQTDMDAITARQIAGSKMTIGVTVSSLAEAMAAVEAGADYLGIGTVYATPTKEDTKAILGTAGVRDILGGITGLEKVVPTVAIGGINAKNIQRVMFKSQAMRKRLDGIAVVSAIMAADDPKAAAQELRRLATKPPGFINEGRPNPIKAVDYLLRRANSVIKDLGAKHPLCHNMTNLVVQNFAANVALSIGSSPIMANNGDEAPELAALGGALVINMGSITPEATTNYVRAGQAYNACGQPVLFDPVGAGATKLRRETVKRLMADCYFEVIKGNESELSVLWGELDTQQKGVDSGISTSSNLDKAALTMKLAARERNVVVMTGKTDYLSDGIRTYAIKNGSGYLGRITGSGCTLGTTIAACLAAHREDKLLATLSGILMYEIAAERAAVRDDVKGPGTFVPAFIDELANIATLAHEFDGSWLDQAKVERIGIREPDSV